ncbi:MAG: 6-phosphofructokinase [Chloroflexi bacterium]|nr:6-phosphofructokinase [Chloroflexota bacterium]
MTNHRLGILVGGGPAPGINSALSAAVIGAVQAGLDVVGIYDGFQHLMQGRTDMVRPLGISDVSRIHFQGGSIIRTSRANPARSVEDLARTVESLQKLELSHLITIGGEDTASSAARICQHDSADIRIAHIPKTIDNDYRGIDFTFGYFTAVEFLGSEIRNLIFDAEANRTYFLAETMGRSAGWLAYGPAIAGELARGVPTAVIVAAADAELATEIQDTLQNESFKVETTTDLVGVELGACLKNAYAIALGMCDGADYGTNTKAFLASVALAEMARLSQAMGGQPQTIYGLAGLGDLITTGFNPHSRNRTLGEKLCNGRDWQEFLRTNTVEGVAACRARDLAHRLDVATPLLHTIYDVVWLDKPPEETMRAFLRDFSYG